MARAGGGEGVCQPELRFPSAGCGVLLVSQRPWCGTPGSEEPWPPCWLKGKSSGAALGAGSMSPGGSLRHRVASVVLMVVRCAGGRGPGMWSALEVVMKDVREA